VGYLLYGIMACHAAAARQHTAVPAVAPQDSLDALSKAIIIDGLQKAPHPREHPLLPLSALVAALCFARFRWSLLSVSGGRVRLYRVAAEGVGVLTPGTLWAAVCQVGVHGRAERQDFVRDIFLGTKGADLLVRRTNKQTNGRIASHRIAWHGIEDGGWAHPPACTQLLRGRQPSSRHTGTYAQGR
jgi:hypothetical protein